MSSVERVSDYTRLPIEFDPKITENIDRKKQSIFPAGMITFRDVSLSYSEERDEQLVLKHLNFTIKPEAKIGIVGRTGAGKSSIITALFRLVEPLGEILIDDIDIHQLNVELLRANLITIPQDPVLFTGTIRSNLDLTGEFDDKQLWQALEEVQLKNHLIQTNKCLDSPVHEGGGNFSFGQRQLLCLARAMLNRSRILILDEATANIDHKTDRAIQQVIRHKFAHCTVITVAHRLHTIIDSDQIMVIEAGRIVECGVPHHLLSRKDSIFGSMVDRTGGAMSRELRLAAKNAYLNMMSR